MKWHKLLMVAAGLTATASVQADRTMRALSKVEGYVVYAVTTVDGEFNGCDFNKVIKLQNGTAFKCSTYAYTYTYNPDAIVFVKVAQFQGKSIAQVKLLVEGELMDMEPILLKN